MKKMLLFTLLVGGLCTTTPIVQAQERLPEYLQAEKFTQEKLNTMLFSTVVDPHWFQKGNSFWFQYKTSEGTFWYVVDPSARSKKQLFDRDEMASQLTEIVKDPFEARHLPIKNLKAQEDGRTFTFEVVSSQDAKPKKEDKEKKDKKGKTEKEVFYFSYDYPTRKLTHLKDKEKEPKKIRWGSISPDGKTVVYAKDLNLYRMSREDYEKAKKDEKDSTIVEIQLTKDGMEDFGYGIPYSMLNTDTLCNGKRRRVYGVWSPDSRHFATTVSDDRAVKELWVINSMAQPRPTLETYKYQMPGEKEAPIDHLYLFDMSDNSRKEIKVSAYKDQTLGLSYSPWLQKQRDMEDQPLIWLGDNNRFYLSRKSRDLHRVDICSYTVGQDSIVPVIEERMNTYQETRPLHLLNNGKDLIQWSERDGWAHLYLYDDKGNLKNRITKGPWHVEEILKVDDKARVVYFTANGMNPKENPYYEHLYRVNLDGSGLKQLSKGDYFHRVEVDDEARFVVDNFSRVNTVPCADLLDTNGNKVMTIQESDFSQLFAADGVTDLYGVMYKPFNFDSTKVYPIVDYVYPGPQVEGTVYPFTRMTPRTDRLAQAGFIVISVGQRGGHPSRSKWYHNYGYGNMRTAAMCQYPDFFKVAVSCAGNHDNNIYNRWWSETHHGVKEVVSEKGDTTFVYKISTNPQIAKQLKGNLLLIHGDIDNNVHPGNTLRVVDALIRAGKRFDMLILPQQRHGFGDMNEYFYWRLVDYFSEHLKGKSEKFVDIPKR